MLELLPAHTLRLPHLRAPTKGCGGQAYTRTGHSETMKYQRKIRRTQVTDLLYYEENNSFDPQSRYWVTAVVASQRIADRRREANLVSHRLTYHLSGRRASPCFPPFFLINSRVFCTFGAFFFSFFFFMFMFFFLILYILYYLVRGS